MVIDHSDSMKSKTKQLRDYVSSRVFKDDKRNTATGNATGGGNGGVSIEVCANNGGARTGMITSTTTSTKAVVSGLGGRGGGVGGSGVGRRLRGESECSSNASSAQLIKVIK